MAEPTLRPLNRPNSIHISRRTVGRWGVAEMMIETLPRSSSASVSICSMSSELKVFCKMLPFWRITGSHFRKHKDQRGNCHWLPLFTHCHLQDPFALLKPGLP
jgi:hypothetical protein